MKNKQPMKFNYEGVDTKGPKPLDPGIYRAKITAAELKESKAGNDMIVLSLEVTETKDGTKLEKARKLTHRVVVAENTLFQVKILAEALEIPELEDNDENTMKDWCDKVKTVGADGVWIKLIHEPYKATGDDGEEEVRQSMRVGRFLKSAQTADSRNIGETPSNGASNGASTEGATKRPRQRGGATAEA